VNARTTVRPFFDPKTWTVSYVVAVNARKTAAVIDAVLDYDFKSGHTGTTAADEILAYVRAEGLTVEWILETHVHAAVERPLPAAGLLPPAEDDGVSYLKIPLNTLPKASSVH